MKNKPNIPEWMNVLPNHTLISSLEISEIYGLRRDHLKRNIEKGDIPKPASLLKRPGNQPSRNLWKLGDIRKHVKLLTSNSTEL